jgi:hypothetical protein
VRAYAVRHVHDPRGEETIMADAEPLAPSEPVAPEQARLDVVDTVGALLYQMQEGDFHRDQITDLTETMSFEHLDAAVELLVGISQACRLSMEWWINFRSTIAPPESTQDSQSASGTTDWERDTEQTPDSEPQRVAGDVAETTEANRSTVDTSAFDNLPDIRELLQRAGVPQRGQGPGVD